jgi:hypothetical protein
LIIVSESMARGMANEIGRTADEGAERSVADGGRVSGDVIQVFRHRNTPAM